MRNPFCTIQMYATCTIIVEVYGIYQTIYSGIRRIFIIWIP
jgi:hypothetical protein